MDLSLSCVFLGCLTGWMTRLLRRAVIALLVLALGHGEHTPSPTVLVSPVELNEEQLRSPARKEVNVTLVGDEWAVGLGVVRALTDRWLQEAIQGDDSVPGGLGWLTTVGPLLSTADVSRASATRLTISLGWYPEYDVRDPELVRFTAPWWATAHNVSAESPLTNLTVSPSTPRVSVSGLVGQHVAEEDLRSQSHSLLMMLEGCDWHPDAGTRGSAAYVALSRAVVSTTVAQMTPDRSGWMLAASGLLRARRENASHLTLEVPPLAAYSISSPETVEITVPAEVSSRPIASPRVHL